MAEHPNAEVVRLAYELFAKGDVDGLLELYTDDAVWHVPGKCALAGDYRGREGFRSYLAKIDELSGGTYTIVELHDILAGDEHVVALHRAHATREGKTYDQNEILVFHVRDGRIVEGWEAYPDLYGVDDFWA